MSANSERRWDPEDIHFVIDPRCAKSSDYTVIDSSEDGCVTVLDADEPIASAARAAINVKGRDSILLVATTDDEVWRIMQLCTTDKTVRYETAAQALGCTEVTASGDGIGTIRGVVEIVTPPHSSRRENRRSVPEYIVTSTLQTSHSSTVDGSS